MLKQRHEKHKINQQLHDIHDKIQIHHDHPFTFPLALVREIVTIKNILNYHPKHRDGENAMLECEEDHDGRVAVHRTCSAVVESGEVPEEEGGHEGREAQVFKKTVGCAAGDVVDSVGCEPVEDFAGEEGTEEEKEEVGEFLVEDSYSEKSIDDGDPEAILNVSEFNVSQRFEEGPLEEGGKNEQTSESKVAEYQITR